MVVPGLVTAAAARAARITAAARIAAQIAAVHAAHRPPLLETVDVGATTYHVPAHRETGSQREVALSGAARVDSTGPDRFHKCSIEVLGKRRVRLHLCVRAGMFDYTAAPERTII